MYRLLATWAAFLLVWGATADSEAEETPPAASTSLAEASQEDASVEATASAAESAEAEDEEDEKVVKVPTFESLGSYERAAVSYALKKRELSIDRSPEGKVLGKIHVVNLDVFGKAEGFLRLANIFHITTREYVIEREVLLRPGEMWSPAVVMDTQRRLKDPLFSSLVVLMPVESKEEGKVDLLVVTRDVWSLRMNSTFEAFQGELTGLTLSLAENNIFGRRKHGAFVFDMNQSNFSLGPQYLDKYFAGTRLTLTGRANAIFSRETSEFEGTSSFAELAYPLFSLREKWGAGVRFSHFEAPVRFFQGLEVERYDIPETEEIESFDRTYQAQTLSLQTHVVRSFGSSVIQRVSMGHTFSLVRPDFVDGFEGNEMQRAAFARDVFPRSERVSALFASYNLFRPDFVIYRDLNSFDLAEDVRLGPELSATVSAGLPAIGSEFHFYNASVGASYVFDWAQDGFLRLSTGANTRLQIANRELMQETELIDNFISNTIKVATPRVADRFRIVAQANLGIRLRERGNDRFLLGGGNGLRGYILNEFNGQKRVLTNLEVRSMPLKILFARLGAVAFWDMGHVADRLGDLRMKHGVGFGIRSLLPQLQPVVFRIDWALPLNEVNAGFPGRLSAGVAQTF